MGYDTADDAAVYQISEDVAIIETVDFFPPMVDDPYVFGQVAAANALSDVYAMGGEPRLALNLLCYPSDKLSPAHVGAILAGGAGKVAEAGALLCGGHTIEDKEPKYGLCVTGFVHPRKMLSNASAQVGDRLILTKALGSGILNTAAKAGLLGEGPYAALVETMTALNAAAARAMQPYAVHACTDVTGFGLAGHALEMAEGSGLCVQLYARELPLLPDAADFAAMGIVPAGAYRNRKRAEGKAAIAPDVPLNISDILFDPQTSGGLLISVAEADAAALLEDIQTHCPDARIVGELRPREEAFLAASL